MRAPAVLRSGCRWRAPSALAERRSCVSGLRGGSSRFACWLAGRGSEEEEEEEGSYREGGREGEEGEARTALLPARVHTYTDVSEALFAQVEIAWMNGWLTGMWLAGSSFCLLPAAATAAALPLQSTRTGQGQMRSVRACLLPPPPVIVGVGGGGPQGRLGNVCLIQSWSLAGRLGWPGVSAASCNLQVRSCFLSR